MSFKLANLTSNQIKSLPEGLKQDYDDLKKLTDNFDPDFYIDEFVEFDNEAWADINPLVIPKVKKIKQNSKIEPPKKDTPKPKFEKGKVFYYKSGATATIERVSNRKGEVMYKLSTRKGLIEQSALFKLIGETLFHKKPEATKKPVKPSPKPVEKPLKVEKVEQGKIEFNWRKKLPAELIEKGKEVVLATTFRAIQVKEETPTVMKTVAYKGDYILVNEDNHPHAILTATMAKRFMNDAKIKGKYGSILGDYDKDGIPNVDDPAPLSGGTKEPIEEIRLSDELKEIIEYRKKFEDVRKEFLEKLANFAKYEVDIKSRTKTPFSIINKLRRKLVKGSSTQVTDIVGAMVIFGSQSRLEAFKDDVNKGGLGKIVEFDDYYKKPNNGYRAYHWNLIYNGGIVELQAKTVRQKKIAKQSHTIYKTGKLIPEFIDSLTWAAYNADLGEDKYQKAVDAILSDTAKTKHYLTTEEFTIENGKKKPTTKVKSTKKPVVKAKAKSDDSKPCNADFMDATEMITKVVKVLEDNAFEWHRMYDKKQFKTNTKEVLGVYKTTGKGNTKVLFKIREWIPGIWPRKNDQWFSLCLDKWTLTKMPKGSVPKYGGKKKIISQHQLRAIYNTKGADKFGGCLVVYREAMKCQAEGTCSTEEVKEMRKKAYARCGNLGKKFVAHPNRMKLLYNAARKLMQEEGLKWHEAISKAAKELNKE